MKADDILLLGLKQSVAAVSRIDGQIIWSTKLSGGMGQNFVTLISDFTHVFAYAGGKLHCLELQTGRIVWTNELKGYGYGLASLCVPGMTASDTALVQQIVAQAAAAASAASA
jgi:outer membrane protein assembly factor BamB